MNKRPEGAPAKPNQTHKLLSAKTGVALLAASLAVYEASKLADDYVTHRGAVKTVHASNRPTPVGIGPTALDIAIANMGLAIQNQCDPAQSKNTCRVADQTTAGNEQVETVTMQNDQGHKYTVTLYKSSNSGPAHFDKINFSRPNADPIDLTYHEQPNGSVSWDETGLGANPSEAFNTRNVVGQQLIGNFVSSLQPYDFLPNPGSSGVDNL